MGILKQAKSVDAKQMKYQSNQNHCPQMLPSNYLTLRHSAQVEADDMVHHTDQMRP